MGFIFPLLSLGLCEKKTVLQLNIGGGLNSMGDLFLSRSLCFAKKSGFKTKRRKRVNSPKWYRGLKRKLRQINVCNLLVCSRYAGSTPRRRNNFLAN